MNSHLNTHVHTGGSHMYSGSLRPLPYRLLGGMGGGGWRVLAAIYHPGHPGPLSQMLNPVWSRFYWGEWILEKWAHSAVPGGIWRAPTVSTGA